MRKPCFCETDDYMLWDQNNEPVYGVSGARASIIIRISKEQGTVGMPINFCPYCGKKLAEIEEEESAERHTLDELYQRGEMSTRLTNILHRNITRRLNVKDPALEDVSKTTERMVNKWYGMGQNAMQELRGIMEKYGVKFAGED